jgi:hypothetical protein
MLPVAHQNWMETTGAVKSGSTNTLSPLESSRISTCGAVRRGRSELMKKSGKLEVVQLTLFVVSHEQNVSGG